MPYILDPLYVQDPGGGIISDNAAWFRYMNPVKPPIWAGRACLVQALDQNIILNLTAPVGTWTGIYYGLMSQLGNWEYNVRKIDESIEVSPLYKGFYELVMNEKQNIEIKIKKVIDDVITHSSDLELLKHDFRRYKEFYDYFDFEKKKGRPDEHSLKAVFIDMVDYHSGEGTPGRLSMVALQMNNIFPTIIQDFYQMKSSEDTETNPRLNKLANVEKDMLKTKWNAYVQWKEEFGSVVRERYEKLKQLIESKTTMIEKSREWIKPYIARYNLLKEGMSNPLVRAHALVSEFQPAIQPTSFSSITLWAWKEFPAPEFYKVPGEFFSTNKDVVNYIKVDGDRAVLADKWTRQNLLLSTETGLRAKYPFVDDEWIDEKLTELYFRDDLLKARKRVNKTYLYYAFLEIRFDVGTARSATGVEIEDINITLRGYWMSRNVLLTKLLELKAKQEEFENEIDAMLGESQLNNYRERFGKREFKKIAKKAGFTDEKVVNIMIKSIKDEFGSVCNFIDVCKRDMKIVDDALGNKIDRKVMDSIKSHFREKPSSPSGLSKISEDFSRSIGSISRAVTKFLGFFDITFNFYRRGPYETSFKNRISKFYLTNLGKVYFGPTVKFVRAQIMK